MPDRRPLIAGNWKMNGLRADGTALARDLAGRLAAAGSAGFDLLVCPPATLLHAVGEALAGSGIALGGQDCHAAEKGAHTGDVSAWMLADIGCSHVIVGHSERRHDHGEDDAAVRAKAAAAHKAGLTAIICVGETEAERDAGEAEAVVARQLEGSIPQGADAVDTVIAYEPVWAIGTGRTPTVADIAAMHGMIRRRLHGLVASPDSVRILYGGSMKPGNAAEIMAVADVDGGLVGGASLKADDFWQIALSVR
ncbi:triose-phosphate isomerase [Rhodospirillum centenum]|uniref:Triosephosphate isomerase n=1 Tax=Rhodospirillum centenum (strain ATCC 51521 / SW) TaxID=414684 RepID=B6IQ25_RHOCS|nr:triose-phosphate isomerase [Rhodospirillum centenum]ACI97561.1 triosephosphate isomerase [Rhodospirillum centenum SW]